MNQGFGIIIQARTGSTRLPSKILKPVDGDHSFLDVLLVKLTRSFDKNQIFLATSTNPNDEILLDFAERYQIHGFAGDEANVQKRFIDCAEEHGLSTVVRICSDNPFLDITALKHLISAYTAQDYFSYSVNGTPAIMTHFGFFAEIVSLKALQKVQQEGAEGCFEHVTNCIWSEPERFEVGFVPISIANTSIRATLDTFDDFENLKKIYSDFYDKQNPEKQNYTDLIAFVERDSALLDKMKRQIYANTK